MADPNLVSNTAATKEVATVFRSVDVSAADKVMHTEFGYYHTRGILLAEGGDVELVDHTDTTIVLVGLVAGVIHPISCKEIKTANTTATGIVAAF